MAGNDRRGRSSGGGALHKGRRGSSRAPALLETKRLCSEAGAHEKNLPSLEKGGLEDRHLGLRRAWQSNDSNKRVGIVHRNLINPENVDKGSEYRACRWKFLVNNFRKEFQRLRVDPVDGPVTHKRRVHNSLKVTTMAQRPMWVVSSRSNARKWAEPPQSQGEKSGRRRVPREPSRPARLRRPGRSSGPTKGET